MKKKMKRPKLPVKRQTGVRFEIRPNNQFFFDNKKAWVDLWREGIRGTTISFDSRAEAERRYKKLPRGLRSRCEVMGVRYYIN